MQFIIILLLFASAAEIAYCQREFITPYDFGHLFESQDDAAADFGWMYNPLSINDEKEYFTYIYEVPDAGELLYTYTRPEIGDVKASTGFKP